MVLRAPLLLLLLTPLIGCGETFAPSAPIEVDDDDSSPLGDDDDTDDDDAADDDDTVDDDDTEPPEPTRFSVVTLNLQSGIVSSFTVDTRTQLVIDLIDNLQPDFVALQEVAQSLTLTNRAEVIAQATGYSWDWEITDDSLLGEEGVGVLTRGALVSREVIVLPNPKSFGSIVRVALGVTATTESGDVRVFSTHFGDPTFGGAEDRAEQAVALFQGVDGNPSPLPGVVAGDMETTPPSDAMAFLRGEMSLQSITSDWTDAWPAANPSSPGDTVPSSGPNERQDFQYLVGGASSSGVVESCELVLTQPDGLVYASDHLGVLCTYLLP